MTTPDIAGLCNRDPATFPTNDPTNPLHRLADDLQRGRLKVEGVKEDVTYALSTLERQAAEIERLRDALWPFAQVKPTAAKGFVNICALNVDVIEARAALTGEDTATLSLSGKTQTDARTRGDECTS
jgi:hypothetical protein